MDWRQLPPPLPYAVFFAFNDFFEDYFLIIIIILLFRK